MPKTVEFASLTIRAPNGMDLESYLEGIVTPAFFDAQTLQHGNSRYAYSLSSVNLFNAIFDGVTLYFIAGRFVRSEIISREKRVVGRKLVNSSGQFDLATTSIFALCLNNHRIIFAQETERNPKLDEFGKYITRMLRIKWYEFQNRTYDQRQQEKLDNLRDRKSTREEIKKEYPLPDINIIPIATDENIREFIDRFSIIQTASIEYILPNQDWDEDGFDAAIREKAEAAASIKTLLSFHNSKGLNIEPIADQIVVAEDANTQVKLVGKDKAGDRLTGSNDDFKFVSTVAEISPSLSIASVSLYAKLIEYTEQGIVKVQGILRDSDFLNDWFGRTGRKLQKQEEAIPQENEEEKEDENQDGEAAS